MDPAVLGDYITGGGLVVAIAGLALVFRQISQVKEQLLQAKKQMQLDAALQAKADLQAELAQKSASLSALLQLDQVFAAYNAERDWVRRNYGREAPKEKMNLVGYLGAFERLGWAVDEGFLSIERAYGFYGGRLRQLIRTIETRRLLIEANQGGWDNVIQFVVKMHQWTVAGDHRPLVATAVRRQDPTFPDTDEELLNKLKQRLAKASTAHIADEPDEPDG